MKDCDVLVIGGGISGISFAHHAARAGRRVLLVEREERAGGCLASREGPGDFWYELGAHTAYNSYGAFLELFDELGLQDRVQQRSKPVLRFLEGGRVAPGKNLGALLRQFGKLELLGAVPGWFRKVGPEATVRERFSRFVGPANYARVLGPMLSAVPSQKADDLPAGSLFKKRPRREDVPRSFTFKGGLAGLPLAALEHTGIESRLGRSAVSLVRSGSGWCATFDDGSTASAPTLALALPPRAAAGLLGMVAPDLAALVGQVLEVQLDSLGLVLARDAVELPASTFLIPLQDSFHSIVTRDVVPDERLRAFTFHFKPGSSAGERMRRALEVLGVERSAVLHHSERSAVLPALRRGHAELVERIDQELKGGSLALCGNWFEGLSIEDCALRSRSEWSRLA